MSGRKGRKSKKKKKKSILSGIHYRNGGGMFRINPSDAFSVLPTFILSPKRHVVCQRAFIKLNQRENSVKPSRSLRRDVPTGYQRRRLVLLGGWACGTNPRSRGGEASDSGSVNVAERNI